MRGHTIILCGADKAEHRVHISGTLEAAKRAAEAGAGPDDRVRIKTSRGTTWTLDADGWRHDTGRRG